MIRFRASIAVLVLLAGGILPATAPAASDGMAGTPPGGRCDTPARQGEDFCFKGGAGRPYGDYCCNKQSGWYGARREVAGERQAREILSHYFSGRKGTIGSMQERPMFFEAEILDESGKLIDRVIVHKRSGRIRSIMQ